VPIYLTTILGTILTIIAIYILNKKQTSKTKD